MTAIVKQSVDPTYCNYIVERLRHILERFHVCTYVWYVGSSNISRRSVKAHNAHLINIPMWARNRKECTNNHVAQKLCYVRMYVQRSTEQSVVKSTEIQDLCSVMPISRDNVCRSRFVPLRANSHERDLRKGHVGNWFPFVVVVLHNAPDPLHFVRESTFGCTFGILLRCCFVTLIRN